LRTSKSLSLGELISRDFDYLFALFYFSFSSKMLKGIPEN